MAKGEERELKQSFPRELLEQPSLARLDCFKAYTVAHPFLAQSDEKIRSALREPGGALLIFIIGPTGVGKTTLLTFIQQRLLRHAQDQLSHDPDYGASYQIGCHGSLGSTVPLARLLHACAHGGLGATHRLQSGKRSGLASL